MDAIMVSVVAVLLANADGRSGQLLSDLLNQRPDRARVLMIFFGTFVANAIVSATGGAIADRMIGQGVLQLFLAFAMGSAAVTLLWQRHWGASVDTLAKASVPMLTARMLLSQFGDRSQFLIGALAATAGAGLWAAAGGAAGWLLAIVPVMAMGAALTAHRAARWLRWTAAMILAIWAARALRIAFGV